MGDTSDNKENEQRLAEACRTYARQKQKVLAASNGSLAIKGEDQEQEVKVNGNGTAETCTTEQARSTHLYLTAIVGYYILLQLYKY